MNVCVTLGLQWKVKYDAIGRREKRGRERWLVVRGSIDCSLLS